MTRTAAPAAALAREANKDRQLSTKIKGSVTGSQERKRWLPSFREALVAADARGFEIHEADGGKGAVFQGRPHKAFGQKAVADSFPEIAEELGAVVDLERKLVQGREQLPDELADLLEGKVAEQIVERGQFFPAHRALAEGVGRGGDKKEAIRPELLAAKAGALERLIGKDQVEKPVLEGLQEADGVADDEADRVAAVGLQKLQEDRLQIAFVDGIGGADAQRGSGKGRGVQLLDGQILQIQNAPGVIQKEKPLPRQGDVFLLRMKRGFPTSFSSSAIRLVTVDWAMYMSLAVWVKFFTFARVRKVFSVWVSMERLLSLIIKSNYYNQNYSLYK